MTSDEWHYVVAGTSKGPHTTLEIEGLIARGAITPETLVWNPRLPVWEAASQHFVFQGGFSSQAQQPMVGIGPDGLYAGAPSRGFGEAFQVCFAKYVTFSGRASRSEYWYFMLWQVIIGAATGFIDALVFPLSGTGPLNGIASLVLLLPTLAVSWRRLHDIDRSGWWVGGFYLFMIAIVTIAAIAFGASLIDDAGPGADGPAIAFFSLLGIGMLIYGIVMLVWYCTRGTLGPNRYG